MQQNNTKVLDEIISSQRPYYDKSGLGYNQIEKGSSSKTTEQRSYAETVRGSPKKEEGKRNQEEYYRDTAPPRRFRIQNQQQPTIERPEKKKDSEEQHHSEDLPPPGIKLFFLVYVIHVIILGTKL
jgi:hypothetical protein